MRQIEIKNVPTIKMYQKRYTKLRGVDFSTDPAMVDDDHSPWAPNLMPDSGGYPEKRPGYRTLYTYDGRINGIHLHHDSLLVHAGTKIYLHGETPELLKSEVNDERSNSFYYNGKTYILTGAEYLAYNGTTLSAVEGFVPTTQINMLPSTGAGTVYEDINCLTPKRTNSFKVPEGGATVFQLDAKELDSTPVTALVSGVSKVETTDFTVDRTNGKVTFKNSIPSSEGVDSVQITFSKTIAGLSDRIKKCAIYAWYGAGSDSRLFLAGNPDYPNMDFKSGLYDPTYFPNDGWTRIGSDVSAIMGYIKQYDNLVIVKEDSDQDSTFFIRSAEVSNDGVAIFPMRQGITGVGAVSKYSFDYLRDDPLFLTSAGVSAVTLVSGGISQQRTVQNRSEYINARLTKENLTEAVSCVWNGFYLLAVGDTVYLADSRQKVGSQKYETYGYEWYHWENISSRCWLAHDGDLYFGSADGKLRKMNTDIDGVFKYNDDGMPVVASWATKADDDGDFMTRKTLPKRGTGAMIKPYTRSSVKVYAIASTGDDDITTMITARSMDIFDFNNIDFTRFAFTTSDSPRVIAFDTKVKKYISLQFILENDVLNEGFGVYGITKRYTHGNYVKRSG